MTPHRSSVAVVLVLMGLSSLCFADSPKGIEFTKLDDFEDASPWLKGDPNTDLEQKDAAVTTSSEFVKEGKQSLAFLIRVNWTKRPNEKYAKGWPMMRREFEAPRDWSGYDYVYFWLYPKTECHLQQSREEGRRPRAQVVHAQPAVEEDVMERLRQIARLTLVGIAVQQHDRDVRRLSQKVNQEKRIRLQ